MKNKRVDCKRVLKKIKINKLKHKLKETSLLNQAQQIINIETKSDSITDQLNTTDQYMTKTLNKHRNKTKRLKKKPQNGESLRPTTTATFFFFF